MIIHAPISVGELVDKITILELKLAHATNTTSKQNVQYELSHLIQLLEQNNLTRKVDGLRYQLKDINAQLWDIENFKRTCEKEKMFLDKFIVAARDVYIKNDIRASIKKQINDLCNSSIVEEKIY